jgi:hypothetical protein
MKIFDHEDGLIFKDVCSKLDQYKVVLVKVAGGHIQHGEDNEEVWFFRLGKKQSPVVPISDDEVMAPTVIRSHCNKLGVPLDIFGWHFA